MSQTNLSPSPGALGLHSPALGPWFTDANITLDLPDTRLAVTLTSDGTWQPPAAGVLSLFVATATRPAPLARLRDPEGNPAFETGRLVGVFELLPQVTTRLGGLMRKLPSLAGAQPPTGPTRPIPHTFALEFTPPTLDAAFALARVDGLLTFPTGISDESARLAYLGLTKTGATLANSPAPMRDLFRPGQSMLEFPNGTRLWSFDPRGHALDPGAVACWLAWLAGENGFAGLYGSGDRTAAIKPGSERLTIELVNPHEGPLDADTLPRLTLSNATGTGRLRHRTAEQTPISVTFTAPPAAPAPDPLPLARAAVLPDGSYAETLTLSSANAPLTRDHVRVAITSIERHLIGQPRHTTAAAGTPDKRRADDQARESTRVRVERATNATLLPHPGAIAGAILTALQSADPVDLATWAIGLDYGPPATPGALPDISPPATLTLTAAALVGGGTAAAGTVAGQRALLTIELPEDAAGAWVRAWTQGFAPDTGERDRLDGGAGVAIAEADKAIARLVVPLPDGAVTPQAPLGA
ncbi:MAG: hypothetical protein H6701_15505, partial [Myxococcales bacterium]|nr:hypothetical protein [Myxococcales bacterium]